MKALVGRCNYDLHTYSHRQFWRLVRDLTSCGWTVTIRANEERRPPWKLPEAEDGYECWVQNPGYDDMDVSRCRRGKTAWAALKKAVEEVVGPAESGTANAAGQGRREATYPAPAGSALDSEEPEDREERCDSCGETSHCLMRGLCPMCYELNGGTHD